MIYKRFTSNGISMDGDGKDSVTTEVAADTRISQIIRL